MANLSSAEAGHTAQDAELWESLKNAIAASSGYQSWRAEKLKATATAVSDEQLVRLYLRDTLETLAY